MQHIAHHILHVGMICKLSLQHNFFPSSSVWDPSCRSLNNFWGGSITLHIIHLFSFMTLFNGSLHIWHFNLLHPLEAQTLKAFCHLKCLRLKGMKEKLSYAWFISVQPWHRHCPTGISFLFALKWFENPTCIIFSNTFHMLTVGT